MTATPMQQHYEMLYIIPMKYGVSDLDGIHAKAREIIEQEGGKITFEDKFKKQKFAYRIQDGSSGYVNQGYYTLIEFDAEKEKIHFMENQLKMTPEILRQMIVTKRLKTEEQLQKEQAFREQMAKEEEQKPLEKSAPEPTVTPVATDEVLEKPAKPEKVSLEELDKKLNELLNPDNF